MSSYLSIIGGAEKEIVIERSKFISAIKAVENETAAKEFLAERKKLHPQATHNCYAFIAGITAEKQKFSDDGEPQGTAGLPILDSIKKSGLKNVAVVVTRYFGGIKLGAGGLTRAYSTSATEAIKEAKKVLYTLCQEIELLLSYDKYPLMLKFLEGKEIKVKETIFEAEITLKLIIKKDEEPQTYLELNDYFLGGINYKKTQEYYYPIVGQQ